MKPLAPITALSVTIGKAFLHHTRRWPKPGDLVKSMSSEVRESLHRLTSDQVSKMRVDPVELMDESFEARRSISKLLSDFEARFNRRRM